MYVFNHMVDETSYKKQKGMREYFPLLFTSRKKHALLRKEMFKMLKKIIGGVLMCGVVVPLSIILSITDGVNLILTYIGKGLKWASNV